MKRTSFSTFAMLGRNARPFCDVDHTLDVSADLLRRQISLVGSWTFSKLGQAECAEFVAERNVPVDRLFTHRWKLEEAEQACRLFDTRSTGKGVFLPN
ncbi:MAG: hypothetical protein ACREB6_01015 [Rhodospirillales bacterium]